MRARTIDASRLLRRAPPLLGVIVVVLVALRTGTSLHDVARFGSARTHALAFGLVVSDLLLRSLRVCCIGRGQGLRIPLATSIRAQLAGEAGGAVTPARVGSDPAKITVLGRARVSPAEGAAIFVGEMWSEVLALIVIVTATIIGFPESRHSAPGALVYAATGLVLTGSFLGLARSARAKPPALWRRFRLDERRWRRVRSAARTFVESCHRLARPRPGIVGAVVATAFLHVAARLAVLPALLAGSAQGLNTGAILGWTLLLFYGGALVPAPAGGGTIELAFAAALSPYLPDGAAVPALVWWRIYTFHLGAAAGGISLLLSKGKGVGVRTT